MCADLEQARENEFTESSLAIHQADTSRDECPLAMKENIVIPIKIERLKLWTRWTLEATSWLICLGLLAASGAVAGLARPGLANLGLRSHSHTRTRQWPDAGIGRSVALAAPARPGRQSTAAGNASGWMMWSPSSDFTRRLARTGRQGAASRLGNHDAFEAGVLPVRSHNIVVHDGGSRWRDVRVWKEGGSTCGSCSFNPRSHADGCDKLLRGLDGNANAGPGKWVAIEGAADLARNDKSRVMRIGVGTYLNGVRWTGPIPTVPYVVELEARRLSGSDFFCGLTFPVRTGTESVSLILGGWGGSLVGISSIAGLDASENSTASQHDFENQRWYRIRVEVGKERLQAWIDDRQVVDAHTEGQRLSLREGPIEDCAPFGLATWETSAELRGVKWRKLGD